MLPWRTSPKTGGSADQPIPFPAPHCLGQGDGEKKGMETAQPIHLLDPGPNAGFPTNSSSGIPDAVFLATTTRSEE